MLLGRGYHSQPSLVNPYSISCALIRDCALNGANTVSVILTMDMNESIIDKALKCKPSFPERNIGE